MKLNFRGDVGPAPGARCHPGMAQGCRPKADPGLMVARNRSRQDTLLGQRIPLKRIRAMAKDLPREEEQRGTRRVFMWGAVIAAAFFVALMIIFILGPS